MARHIMMGRAKLLAAFAVVAAVVAGCGPGKELPAEVETHKGTDTGERAVAVPAASEPEAKSHVEKVMKTFTGGKPELAAKGKASRLVLKGIMLFPVDGQKVPVDATRSIVAVWPDRFAGVNDIQPPGAKVLVRAWLNRPQFTMMNGDLTIPPVDKVETEANFAADVTAQHWMCLFQPLTDPKAIVFDLRKQLVNQQSVQTLKLALGSFPVFQLTFDANTDALLRVEYTLAESGAQRRRQWTMIEHKTGPDGLLLPRRMECRHDNVVVEEWTADKWEFPPTIDDKEFTPPQK